MKRHKSHTKQHTAEGRQTHQATYRQTQTHTHAQELLGWSVCWGSFVSLFGSDGIDLVVFAGEIITALESGKLNGAGGHRHRESSCCSSQQICRRQGEGLPAN